MATSPVYGNSLCSLNEVMIVLSNPIVSVII